MNTTNHRSSEMRVAIVSASKIQRESLKTLIEQNGPIVTGAANFRDFFKQPTNNKPDVLLVDLDHANDDELEKMSALIAENNIPVLFNDSPNVPTAPGLLRDDWANNLIGKLYELAQPKTNRKPYGLLDRPRFVQQNAFRSPRVLILSRSKTRRRVLELILINQGFNETTEAAYDPRFTNIKRRDFDVIVMDEHNLGPDQAPIFNSLLSQSDTPVHLCNSSKIPTAVAERKQWGRQLAGQLIQLHRKHSPLPRSATTTAALEAMKHSEQTTASVDTAEKWGDRMADKLSRLRSSIKTNHDDFMGESVTTPAPAMLPEAHGPSIIEKVTAHIEESKTESKSMQQRISKELKRDLKYLPPEKLAAIQPASNELFQDNESTERVIEKSSPNKKRNLDMVDSSNFEKLPKLPIPGLETDPIASVKNQAMTESEIERFFDFNKKLEEADRLIMEKARQSATTAKKNVKHKLMIVDDNVMNPFVSQPSRTRNSKVTAKPYRKKTAMARIVNSLHDIKRLIPKIFN